MVKNQSEHTKSAHLLFDLIFQTTNSPPVPQYRLIAPSSRLKSLIRLFPDLGKAINAGEKWTKEKVSIVTTQEQYVARAVSYYPQKGQDRLSLNINIGTKLRKFAENWDATGRPACEIEGKYIASDHGADRIELNFPVD